MKRWMNLFIFIAILFFQSHLSAYKYDVSIAMIFQDDAPYLKEWIEFHRLQGVDHFYLFNNLSTDNYKEVLRPYLKKGIVSLYEWPYPSDNVEEWDKIQVAAYDAAWKMAIHQTKWLALLDSDEFLFPVEGGTLKHFLKDYEAYGGLCVNWVMYGTSNVSRIPCHQLLIETLVMSAGCGHTHFKTIFRPERADRITNPHYVKYRDGYYAVTPSHQRATPGCIDIEKIRINHYWTRDEYYLHNIKIPRRAKWGTPPETCHLWSTMNNVCYDPAIFHFVQALRKKMGLEQ